MPNAWGFDIGVEMFSKDLPFEVVEGNFTNQNDISTKISGLAAGYYVAHTANDYHFTFPTEDVEGFATLADYLYAKLGGRIGIKIKDGLTETNMTSFIEAIPNNAIYNPKTVEINGEDYFTAFIGGFDSALWQYFGNGNAYNDFTGLCLHGANQSMIDGEYIYRMTTTSDRILYYLKAKEVGTHDIAHVKDYLIGKNIKIYTAMG